MTFFPISVARPIASSIAFRPEMRRMKISRPERAQKIEPRMIAAKMTLATRELTRLIRNQLSCGETGSLTVAAP
jgi:hypothetical protein